MGLFGKIKNILFEDDDEVGEMPVYTKEDVKEVQKAIEEEHIQAPFDPNPINPTNESHFNNVKRDIDMQFDDNDVIGEVKGAKEIVQVPEPEVPPVVVEKPKEEKKSPFLSFDEAEFERLNSRITSNENKVRSESIKETPTREIKNEMPAFSEARRANNNFSSTSTMTEKSVNNPDRYKINVPSGKKPFKPSPVISPVYGILDKNYKKDEIVDKKDGMKREKIVKPIVHKDNDNVEVDVYEEKAIAAVDIDSVRKKAFGGLEMLERKATSDTLEKQKNKKEEVVVKEVPVKEEIPKEKVVKKEEPSVEDQLEDKEFEVTNVIDVSEEKDNIEEKFPVKEEKKQKPKALDEMEKTNTLQILDDIEKELNSIKPISKENSVSEDDEMREHLEKSDTLENDLFNLIDSMYEQDDQGEEEEND